MIVDDRRRSQKIEHGSIFCDRLRSSAIMIAGSQAIAEVCFHNAGSHIIAAIISIAAVNSKTGLTIGTII